MPSPEVQRKLTAILSADVAGYCRLMAAEDTGFRLIITKEGEVYDPFIQFVWRFIRGHDKTLEPYLRDLARKFGEEAEPEPVG